MWWMKTSSAIITIKAPMGSICQVNTYNMTVQFYNLKHGLRTPNEGINQRYLKIGPMWQTKYASAVPKNLGVVVNFRPCSEGYPSLGVRSPWPCPGQRIIQLSCLFKLFDCYASLVCQCPENQTENQK